jgi:uncharacterized membrane protein
MVLLLAFLAGVVAGLRSMTGPAVIAWAAWRQWIDLRGSPFAAIGSPTAVAVFALAALGELVFDKLPAAPNRTAFPGLAARIALGGLCGAAIASSAAASLALGAVLGAAGGVAGAFGGFELRTRLTRASGRGFIVALLEDAIAIGGGLLIVAQL